MLANRTCPCPALHAFVHERLTEPPAEVLVVAPALNSRLAHWVSDSDGADTAAKERLDVAVDGLSIEGVDVTGHVGDAQPLVAIEDALATFRADEVILSTFPAGESHWLEDGLLEEARAHLSVPVRHYVSEYGLAEAPGPGSAGA